jgi:cell division protein FtsN
MVKDYRRKNSARRQSGGISKQLLLVLVCFLSGYLTASVFDFTSLSGWINTQLLAQHPVPAGKQIAQPNTPKPKFEFYTLLANERSTTEQAPASADVATAKPTITAPPADRVSQPPVKNLAGQVPAPAVAIETAKPLPAEPVILSKNTYLVQVAAFKSRQEAERMKAALVLKGFAVTISTISQQRINWYRVNLGPYASRPLAEKAQIAVARSEHIVGMIRKMDA